MDKVTGGALAAQAWRRYMEQAHAFLPPRDFDWLLPDQEPEMEDDPRNPFYQDLADEFADEAGIEPAPPPRLEFELPRPEPDAPPN
jgi:penicillin-binding protein 1A